MKWQSAVAFGTGISGATALMLYTTANQIGPRIMWASDLCPQSNVSCGVMPVWTIVSALVAGVVTLFVGGFLHKHTETGLSDTA